MIGLENDPTTGETRLVQYVPPAHVIEFLNDLDQVGEDYTWLERHQGDEVQFACLRGKLDELLDSLRRHKQAKGG